MLGLVYLLLAWWVGYHFLKKALPQLFKLSKTKSLFGKLVPIEAWMITLPASFLIGTLFMTWITYLASYAFYHTAKPLLYGNLISMLLFLAISVSIFIANRAEYFRIGNGLKDFNGTVSKLIQFVREHRLEVVFLIVIILVSSFLMFHTLSVKNGNLLVGLSVFSDFGPHLAVIRSFSFGSNFPTEYPHFADGHARYHFLFQFLAGNLEFLGFRIDWAFNLPSILSLVAFLMLLYALAVLMMGEKWVGILTTVLFFFRSSFAFFTFLNTLGPWNQVIPKILSNERFIGNTQHEDWGLWAQNVYVNQRHLAFSLGILMLILILVLPLFRKMMQGLRNAWNNERPFRYWLNEFVLKSNAWAPEDIRRSVTIGLILGLIGFWNGAVFVAALPILFCIALFSKHRLEYLNLAIIAIAISFMESMFFIGAGGSAVQPRLSYGFLAAQPNLPGIMAYYIELLGILPFVAILSLFLAPKGGRWLVVAFSTPLILATTVQLTPDMAVNHKYVIISVLLLNIIVANFLFRLFKWNFSFNAAESFRIFKSKFTRHQPAALSEVDIPPVSQALETGPALENPAPEIPVQDLNVVEAAVTQTSEIVEASGETGNPAPDQVAEQLSDQPVAPELSAGKHAVRLVAKVITVTMVVVLTLTGVVDFITVYNKNIPERSLTFSMTDPVMLWVKQNTGPNEIFLTDLYCIHPILLAGRKIFYGWPYFTWSAGYDTYARDPILREIYGGTSIQRVKELVKNSNISYIVIEDGNRNSQDYKLNEQLIATNFNKVYENFERRIAIYRTY
jgi:hypothetical protein